MKTVALGDILSMTTGRLVAPGGFSAVHALADYMTGDALFTHQLPRACEECAPDLLRQHPSLAEVIVPDSFNDEAHVWRWLAEQVDRFGPELPVSPLVAEDHTRIDPLAELKMLRPDMPVIVVEIPGGAA